MRVCLEAPRKFEVPKEVVVKVVDILGRFVGVELACDKAQLGQKAGWSSMNESTERNESNSAYCNRYHQRCKSRSLRENGCGVR